MLDLLKLNNKLEKLWMTFCITLGLFLVGCLVTGYRPFSFLNNTTSQYQQLISTEQFTQKTYSDLENTIKNKKNAIYYLGYENCPWCNDVLPVLHETIKELDMTINYIDTYGLKEDKVNYPLMQELLKDILKEDKKVYVPNVILIKDGIIIDYHLGTINDHNAHEEELDKKGQEKLKAIYIDMFLGGENVE